MKRTIQNGVVESKLDLRSISGYIESARRFSDGDRNGVVVLRERPDSATVRVQGHDQVSVVMKFWDRSGWRAIVRRATRTTPAWREWNALTRLKDFRVPIARPLSRFSLSDRQGRFSDVLVIEDLGEVQTAQTFVKEALVAGRIVEADKIETQVIAITVGMVAANVLDSDHSMINCLCIENGKVFRVDLEVARIVRSVGASRNLQSQMIARLLTSYIYTVQPFLDRATAFSLRVAEKMDAPRSVLRSAKAIIDQKLEHQRITVGVDSKLPVDW